GLDRTKFDQCLNDTSVFNDVRTEVRQGLTKGNGTPLLDFGSVQIPGARSYADLSVIIDKLLADQLASPGASAAGSGSVPAASAAVCLPGGGCETVAQSEYSSIFGIPVAALGALFSAVLLAVVVAWLRSADRRVLYAAYALGLFGIVFVAYLTYLELFVIHAI